MRANGEVRVLMIATTLAPHIRNLISKLSLKYEVYVIYIAYPSISGELEKNSEEFHHCPIKCPSKIFSLAETRGFRSIYLLPIFVSMLIKIIQARKNHNIDIIHVSDVVPSGFLASLCCKHIPLIVGLRGSDIKVFAKKVLFRWSVKYALKRATKIVALSNDLKQEAIKLGAREDKIEVISGGIDTVQFKPGDKHVAKLRLDLPGKFLILFVGNLIKLKGVDKLIKASAKLICELPHQLVIIGDGPERARLEQLTSNLEVGNALFTGRVQHQDMPLYMNAADVLALPSESEGLPDTVQEAMACGVPVIATNVGGLPELITDGVNGFLLNNEAELEECLQLLISNPELRAEMGANAREFAVNNLSIEKVINQTEELYTSVLKRGSIE